MEEPAVTIYSEEGNFLNSTLTFNSKNYKCDFCDINNEKIKINITSNDYVQDKYEKYFNFEDFKKLNKYFKMFDTLKELENELVELDKKNKIEIVNISEKSLELCIKVLLIDNNKVIIELNKIELNDKEKINKILKENQEIKNELKIRDSKISILEKELQNLIINHNKDIEIINNELKTLKEENKYLKDSFQKLLNKSQNNKFEFHFINGNNYILGKEGKSAKKINSDNWNTTIMGDKEIPKNEISKWKIRLNNFCNNGLDYGIFIGIGPKKICSREDCWALSCCKPELMIKGEYKKINSNDYKGFLKKFDVIEVIVNRIEGILSFNINGTDYGISYNNIPMEDELYPVVFIFTKNHEVEIID